MLAHTPSRGGGDGLTSWQLSSNDFKAEAGREAGRVEGMKGQRQGGRVEGREVERQRGRDLFGSYVKEVKV